MTKSPNSEFCIVIVGAGGLGVPAAWGLAKGISARFSSSKLKQKFNLRLVDPDNIELSNLNRQVLYGEDDIGRPKVEVLKERLELSLSPSTPLNIQCFQETLSTQNYQKLLTESNLVLDCCDNTETKFELNDYCVRHGIPFSYAGVLGDSGLCFFHSGGNTSENEHRGCLRCLFGDFTSKDIEQHSATCSRAGIVGAAAGALGLMQAEFALRFIFGIIEKNSPSVLARLTSEGTILREGSFSVSSDCPFHSSKLESSQLLPLDLTGEKCPMTFLYAKLALERLNSGDTLTVNLADRASTLRVAQSMREEGHIVSLASDETSCVLKIQRL